MHWSFNCNGKPYKTFGVEDWGPSPFGTIMTEDGYDYNEWVGPQKRINVSGKAINTSIFEEVEVIND
jgi:hypothetical protein